MKKSFWIGIGALIAIFIFGFLYWSSLVKNKNKTLVPSPTPLPTITSQDSSVHEIIIAGSEYSFTPSEIMANKGENVALVFKNVGTSPHNLVIPDLGLQTNILKSGESQTLEFTASQTGTFPIYCSVGNHKNLGMEGKLEVK